MPSNWIRNNGVMPVPRDTLVQVEYEDGSGSTNVAGYYSWAQGDPLHRFRVLDCSRWFPWFGGTPPVPSGTRIRVRLRSGEDDIMNRLDWHLDILESSGDVIDYRFIEGEDDTPTVTTDPPIPLGQPVQVSIFTSDTPRVFEPDEWQYREMHRLREGVYKKLPDSVLLMMLNTGDGFKAPPEHHLHQGILDKSKVVYTENDKMGRADRQTLIRLGKYLNRFTEFTDPEIADISNLYRTEVMGVSEVEYARTQKEIVNVYLNGPSSCMSHGVEKYHTDGTHPVSVYATPSVAVLYLERDDRITARTVTNEIRKTYNTIYGDSQTMKPILMDMGYRYGDLEGCSLLRLTNANGDIILPYIDGESDVIDCGDRLMVEEGGELHANQTNGLSIEGAMCEECGDAGNEESMHYSEHHEMSICESCAHEWYYAYDGSYRDWYHPDYASFYLYGDEWYTVEGAGYHDLVIIDDELSSLDDVVFCEIDDEYALHENAIHYKDNNDNDEYTIDDRRLTEPEDSDDMYLTKDLWEYDGRYYREESNYLEAKEEDDERVA